MVLNSHVSWPYNENWIIWDYMEEATGAKLNITALPDGEITTKLPLMMATPEDLPDLVNTYAKKEHVDAYALSGAFVNFADYEEQMPNYQAFLNSVDEVTRKELLNQRTSGDGNVYFAPAYGTHRVTNMRTWLYRKDIFEKHNLKAPTTYDELYEVAKKLKELYPDSYPICFRGDNPNFKLDFLAPPVPNVPTGSAKMAKSNLDFSGWAVCNTGDEELSKFLLGQQPMSNWDAFQQGIVEMGVDELLEIYTTAYNRVVG